MAGFSASTLISDFYSLYDYLFPKMWFPLRLLSALRLFWRLEYLQKYLIGIEPPIFIQGKSLFSRPILSGLYCILQNLKVG